MSLEIKAILKHRAESGGVAAPLQRGWVCGCKNSPSPDDGVGAAPGPLSATAKRTAVRERRGVGGGVRIEREMGGGGVAKERGGRRGVGGKERYARTHTFSVKHMHVRSRAEPPPPPAPRPPLSLGKLSLSVYYR